MIERELQTNSTATPSVLNPVYKLKVNRVAQTLKWLFLTAVAVIILIIIIKLKIIK